MNFFALLLMFAAVLVGFLGFGYLQGPAADWTQMAFFALMISAIAALVFDRRRPI